MNPIRAWLLASLVIGSTWFTLSLYEPDQMSEEARGNTLTIVLIDGLSSSIFKEELEKGNLPVIKKLIENSLWVENGISSFPTMTGYGFYPFITGEDASKSGIYGLRWFDKNRSRGQLRNYVGRTNVQMNHDIVNEPKTLFELAGNAYTASVNTYMNRGVKESVKTGFAHTTAKYEGKTMLSYLVNLPFVGRNWIKNHFQHETDVTDLALAQLKKNPKVQWITYASPDAYNHVNGTDSIYQRLLRHIDHEIGRLLVEISQPQHKNRALAILSDHGIQDVYHNMDVCKELSEKTGLKIERGKSAILYSSDLKAEASSLKDLDAFFVINGNLSSYLYVLGGQTKKTSAAQLENLRIRSGQTINLPKALVEIQGIELCLYWDDHNKEVLILHKTGKAKIASKGHQLSYTVVEGKDPLGYESDSQVVSMVNRGFFDEKAWLHATYKSKYPDALYRFYELMKRDKSGDILITASEGYDMAKDYEAVVSNYKGGHGGANKQIISVPYIFYQPGKQAGKIAYMRAEDLGKRFKVYLFGE